MLGNLGTGPQCPSGTAEAAGQVVGGAGRPGGEAYGRKLTKHRINHFKVQNASKQESGRGCRDPESGASERGGTETKSVRVSAYSCGLGGGGQGTPRGTIWVSGAAEHSPIHDSFQALWAGQGPRVCWG